MWNFALLGVMKKPDPGSGLEIETFRPGKHTFHIYDRRCIPVADRLIERFSATKHTAQISNSRDIPVSQRLIEINCLSKHRVLILRRLWYEPKCSKKVCKALIYKGLQKQNKFDRSQNTRQITYSRVTFSPRFNYMPLHHLNNWKIKKNLKMYGTADFWKNIP